MFREQKAAGGPATFLLNGVLSSFEFDFNDLRILDGRGQEIAPRWKSSVWWGISITTRPPIHDLTDHYDLVIQLAHFDSHNTVQRISWKLFKGTADVPWYVFELPVLFVSFCSPFHLFDAPQVKNYINVYDKNVVTMDVFIDKLLGRGKFEGISPVGAFCGTPNTTF